MRVNVDVEIKLTSDFSSVSETINIELPTVDGYVLLPTRGALRLVFSDTRTLGFCAANILQPYIRMEIIVCNVKACTFILIDSVEGNTVNLHSI